MSVVERFGPGWTGLPSRTFFSTEAAFSNILIKFFPFFFESIGETVSSRPFCEFVGPTDDTVV